MRNIEGSGALLNFHFDQGQSSIYLLVQKVLDQTGCMYMCILQERIQQVGTYIMESVGEMLRRAENLHKYLL